MKRSTSAGGSHCDMVVVAPKVDLVARLDAEFHPKLLRDHDLALGTDAMSHTCKYNLPRVGPRLGHRGCGGSCGSPRTATVAVYIVVGWSLVIDLVGSLVTGLDGLARLSLFHYVALAPAEDPDWAALATYTVVATCLAIASVLVIDHRDLSSD